MSAKPGLVWVGIGCTLRHDGTLDVWEDNAVSADSLPELLLALRTLDPPIPCVSAVFMAYDDGLHHCVGCVTLDGRGINPRCVNGGSYTTREMAEAVNATYTFHVAHFGIKYKHLKGEGE